MPKELMPGSVLERVARRFRLLGDKNRLEILNLLVAEGEMSVMTLVNRTGQNQSSMSKHLSMLCAEGYLGRRKEGQHVYYRVVDPHLPSICMLICGGVEMNRSE